MTTHNLCTNCHTAITPGSRESATWIHPHSGMTLCRPDDLAFAGMSEAMVGEQIDGIAHYSACPAPPNDEDPYFIDRSDWHTVHHHEHGPVLRTYPHGSGSFMGGDDAASLLAIRVCKWLNEGGAD